MYSQETVTMMALNISITPKVPYISLPISSQTPLPIHYLLKTIHPHYYSFAFCIISNKQTLHY